MGLPLLSPLVCQREGKILGPLLRTCDDDRLHRCRCEEVADEIEEQGDTLRYLAAVLTILTSSTSPVRSLLATLPL